MPTDWDSTEQFLKKAGSSGSSLPKKVINVDTDKQPSAVNQTGGMLYEAEIFSDAVNASPKLLCPCCGQSASDIAGAKQLYQVDIKESSGKSHKGDVPPCPVSGLDVPAMVYSVEPCGCRVSAEWAGAFSAELHSRVSGNKPKAVVDMTAKQREAKLAFLTGKLSELYSLQTVCASTNAPREAVDYWIVIVADQMQRLVPSPLNMDPTKMPISPKVEKWAKDGGFATPPKAAFVGPDSLNAAWQPSEFLKELMADWHGAGNSIFELPDASKPKQHVKGEVSLPPPVSGAYVYRMTDGSVSTTPAYPGQMPCGQVAANPYAKVVIDKDKGSLGEDMHLWSQLVKAGMVNPNQLAPWDDTPAGTALLGKKPKLQTLPVEEPEINVIGGTPDEKAAYLTSLKKVLKATHPSEMPKSLLRRIYDYTENSAQQHLCLSVLQQACGVEMKAYDLLKTFHRVQEDLIGYVNGDRFGLLASTIKFVKTFVDLVDIPPPQSPKTVAVPNPVVPEGLAAPVAQPEPKINYTVRKKRTIRRIVE